MDCWDILGIKPTKDTSLIKKAYTSKLSMYSIDEASKDYQNLVSAYKIAIKQAEDNDDGSEKSNKKEHEKENKEQRKVSTIPVTHEVEEISDKFMKKVSELYDDFFKRIDSESWRKLFQSEFLEDDAVKKRVEYKLFYFVSKKYRFPQDVWIVLNDIFSWNDRREELKDIVPAEFVNFIIYKIFSKWSFSYSYFRQDYECNYDEFVELREKGYDEIIKNNIKKASIYFKAAYDMFEGDADLTRLHARCLLKAGEVQAALDVLDNLIKIVPESSEGFLMRAQCYVELGKYDRACYDYKKVLEIRKSSYSALNGLAYCYYMLQNYNAAKDIYKKLAIMCPYDIDVKIKVKEISNKLNEDFNEDYKLKIDIKDGNFRNVIEECTNILQKSNGSDSVSWYKKGYCELKLGQFQEAEVSFKNAIIYNAGIPVKVHFYNSIALFKNKKYEEALYEVDVYRRYSNNPYIFILKGDIKRALKDNDDAISEYCEAHKYGVKNYKVNRVVATSFMESKLYDDAFKCLKRMSLIYNEDKWTFKNLAIASIRTNGLNEYVEVLNEYGNKNKFNELQCYSKFYFGVTYFYLKKYDLSLKFISEAAKGELEAEAYFYMGMIYYELKNEPKALKCAKKAVDLDSKNKKYCDTYDQIKEASYRSVLVRIVKKRPSFENQWITRIQDELKEEKSQSILLKMPELCFDMGGIEDEGIY